MKAFIQTIFCLLILVSCNKKPKKSDVVSQNPKPVLIKIGYYPSFHQPAETIMNLNEKYLIFYSPTSYNPPPPAPPKKNGKHSIEEEREYKKYLYERSELKPFKSDLEKTDINRIENILKSFTADDFKDKDIFPGIDGMSVNIVILYSDGKLIQINPMNSPKPMQRELYNEVLDILLEKNTNENDSIIIGKIKEYH